MQCPSCGAQIEAHERFGHFHVCRYCQSACILDGEAARLAGKMAVLAPSRGPLAVDAEVRLDDRRFRVIGRLRHGHETGFWDEWACRDDNGGSFWISEDGGDFWVEESVPSRSDDAEFSVLEAMRPGSRIEIGDEMFRLAERSTATLESAEGSLPEEVEIGARFRYLDLRSESGAVATIEADLDEGVVDAESMQVFVGRPIMAADLVVEVPGRRDDFEAERAEGVGGRRRVVKKSGRSLQLGCDVCGTPLEVPDPSATSVTCGGCGTVADLTVERLDCGACGAAVPIYGGESARMLSCRSCGSRLERRGEDLEVLGELAKSKKARRAPVPLGSTGELEGTTWRVVGYLRMVQREEGVDYPTDEHLLWSEDQGYAWLTIENGHFSLCRELAKAPMVDFARRKRRSSFEFDGRSWKAFETGRQKVEAVDGELTWVAKVGDRVEYADATSPPYLLSQETSLDEKGNPVEVEWSESVYVDRKDVALAFGVPVPPKRGVAPHQPFRQAQTLRDSALVMVGIGVLQIILLIWAAAQNGEQIASFSVSGDSYGSGWLSEAFEIEDSDGVVAITADANVSNSWVYAGGVLVDAETQEAVQEFEIDISYYFGSEGGESWSEGSRDDTVPLLAPKPGRYHLLLQGQSGYGETAQHPTDQLLPINLRVHEGFVLARFFGIGLLLCLLWCAFVWIPRLSHEMRRWSDE